MIEELWFKPIIWLSPLFWWSMSFRGDDRIKMFGGNTFLSCILGLVVGLFYFVLLRRFDLSNISVSPTVIGVVIATAITEEVTFSGFVAGYLEKLKKDRWLNLFTVALMAAFLRLPILIFMYQVGFTEVAGVLLFVAGSAMINAWIRVYSKNVFGSVLARIGVSLATLV